MDDFSGEFARERSKREIMNCTDPVKLQAICMTLIQCNEHLRSMLLDKIREDLPMLDSTGL